MTCGAGRNETDRQPDPNGQYEGVFTRWYSPYGQTKRQTVTMPLYCSPLYCLIQRPYHSRIVFRVPRYCHEEINEAHKAGLRFVGVQEHPTSASKPDFAQEKARGDGGGISSHVECVILTGVPPSL